MTLFIYAMFVVHPADAKASADNNTSGKGNGQTNSNSNYAPHIQTPLLVEKPPAALRRHMMTGSIH